MIVAIDRFAMNANAKKHIKYLINVLEFKIIKTHKYICRLYHCRLLKNVDKISKFITYIDENAELIL